ncbi:unnamed protein product [Rangifer tarandus platyrhynchus]|uniref:Uncharacterized protein n=1 Tax=Rangifer tarandus platyrhynchus TaxID=3082113 RepID=A0AC59Z112_RANTA
MEMQLAFLRAAPGCFTVEGRGHTFTMARGTALTTVSLPIPVDHSGSPARAPHNPGMLLPQGLCTGHSTPQKCSSYRDLHGRLLYGLEVFFSNIRWHCIED